MLLAIVSFINQNFNSLNFFSLSASTVVLELVSRLFVFVLLFVGVLLSIWRLELSSDRVQTDGVHASSSRRGSRRRRCSPDPTAAIDRSIGVECPTDDDSPRDTALSAR